MIRYLILLSILMGITAQNNQVSQRINELNKRLNTLEDPAILDDIIKDYETELTVEPNNPYIWYNLGNALFKMQDFLNARNAYKRSLEFSDTLQISKVNYNIGNTYLFESKPDTAIRYYKKALELNSEDKDAKYNMELAQAILKEKSKKQESNQNNQQEEPKKQEPSDFAKKLFEEAKKLVSKYKYSEAMQMLEQGLRTDPSVQAFKEFIDKLKKIVEIMRS